MQTILLISPYWKEEHRWMVSSYKLAELWQRLGFKVVVVCMAQETGIDRVSDTLEIHRRKDVFLKDPWNYGIAVGFSGYCAKLAKRLQPDIVVVNKILFWSSVALLRLRLAGYKVVLTTDALVGITWWPRSMIAKIGAAMYARTLGWLIMLCAYKMVFFHPQPEKVLRRYGVARKSLVIPTGIDETLYDADADRVDESVTVTYVGRLESVKGVDDFLAAVAPLKAEYPVLRIQVVGWYPSSSSGQVLHPLVEQYQRDVVFTGLRDDIPEVLAQSDIFALPSYSEGLSNALMEAMSSGCACVASEVGGNAYLLQNGVSGFLFTPGDQEALRAHVRRLLDDKAKRITLGIAARKRIETEFSWNAVGDAYQDLFSSLAT